ncbi:MAG TPA: cytochrome c [Tepidisphaeraceae bacterium]|jgi:hypothetical protein
MFPNQKQKRARLAVSLGGWLICAAGIAALGLAGCQSTDARPAGASDSGPPPKVLGLFPPPPDRSGVELWTDNCNRCHNAPPPERFSDAQWATIVRHMRFRANLTGEEQRKITEFLQASN